MCGENSELLFIVFKTKKIFYLVIANQFFLGMRMLGKFCSMLGRKVRQTPTSLSRRNACNSYLLEYLSHQLFKYGFL